MKRLNELFTLSDGGIFHYLNSLDVPWKEENDDTIPAMLDSEYHLNIAGSRYASPVLVNMNAGEPLTSAQREYIAQMLVLLHGKNWSHLWETMEYDYNPIENYSMVEELSDDVKETTYGRTDTLTHDKDTTETRTLDLTNERTPDLETTETREVQGFDSSTYSPSEQVTTDTSGTDTTTNSGTDTTVTEGTDTDTNVQSGTDSETHSYTLTRTGNIGVTTSQQMIESERALWKWNFFYDVVFTDINRTLTLYVY